MLDGISRIPDLVDQTCQLGMKALAITDHGSLYGAVDFYSECKERGIKPIIGCETYVAHKPPVRPGRDGTQSIPPGVAGARQCRLSQPDAAGHPGPPGGISLPP